MNPRLPFLLLPVLLATPYDAPAAAAPDKPNIIVIFTDDHGWADLGCQEVRKDLRTPHLDSLAAGGLRASNGYVTAPQCVPSRGGLLTGIHQQRFRLESNKEPLNGFNQQQTIASRLQKAGYATGMSGKWHLGPENEIVQHGFHDVFCTQSASGVNLRGWANFDLDGQTIPGAPLQRPGVYHLEANAAAATAFIKRHAREPFFFYLAFRGPHTPLDAPGRYTSRFPGPMPERRRLALAMLSAIDDGVGRILATLREHGLEEKTLIFFMGDNGAPLKMTMEDSPPDRDHGGWDGSLNAPMNGEKGMLSEGGIRVPWLACWKGRIPAGQVYPHPVISLDVAATAAALAGLPPDPALDGVNLLPFFTGQIQSPPHEALHWRWIAQSAIREGDWKLLLGGARSYLFHLGKDPGEQHNLMAQHPDIAARLRARLETWSASLQPPGLQVDEMSPVWDRHFDFFLEGKPAQLTSPKEEAANWSPRNATAALRDGALIVTPEPQGSPKCFLACSRMSLAGPARATIRLRSAGGGPAGLSWRLEGQKDFLPRQSIAFPVPAAPDWQELQTEIPATGRIIHLRFFLPPGETAIQRIEIKSGDGSSGQAWNFASP